MTVAALVASLVVLAPAQTDALARARASLDARDYAAAEAALSEVAPSERGTAAARLWFEVGDFAGAARSAAEALPGADPATRRELLWWGAKSALWLQDAGAARAWTSALAESCVGDEVWAPVVADYTLRAAQLTDVRSDERRGLVASRTVVALAGAMGIALLLARTGRARPGEARAVSTSAPATKDR